MNIRNRIKRIENQTQTGDVCRCFTKNIATAKTAFTAPKRCANCRGIITPSVLVVSNLSAIEDFNYSVKIYAGFNPSLV